MTTLIIPWADLTRDERILALCAVGASMVVVLHFLVFEAATICREVRAFFRGTDGSL